MRDPPLSEDGLGDSEIQGWKANVEAGPTWAFGAGKSGDLLVDFRGGLGNPGHWRQAGEGRMLHWAANQEVLSWVGSEDR